MKKILLVVSVILAIACLCYDLYRLHHGVNGDKMFWWSLGPSVVAAFLGIHLYIEHLKSTEQVRMPGDSTPRDLSDRSPEDIAESRGKVVHITSEVPPLDATQSIPDVVVDTQSDVYTPTLDIKRIQVIK